MHICVCMYIDIVYGLIYNLCAGMCAYCTGVHVRVFARESPERKDVRGILCVCIIVLCMSVFAGFLLMGTFPLFIDLAALLPLRKYPHQCRCKD